MLRAVGGGRHRVAPAHRSWGGRGVLEEPSCSVGDQLVIQLPGTLAEEGKSPLVSRPGAPLTPPDKDISQSAAALLPGFF